MTWSAPAFARPLWRRFSHFVWVPTLVGLTVLSIPELVAQAPSSVSGRVISGVHGGPVEGALVTIMGKERVTLTGADGQFRLTNLAPGEHIVEISFIGHQTLQHPVRVLAEGAAHLDLELPMAAVPLRGVDVDVERRVTPAMAGFLERKARATGFFFTAEDIAAMQARLLTDVLRRVPGAQVQTIEGPYGRSQVVQMGRALGAAGARECNAIYYMDGVPFPVSPEVGINAYVSVRDIEGVEVYSGASRVPSQFNTGQLNARCGVIAIWTRTGPGR